MLNSDETIEAYSRQGLNRTLKYRPHVKWTYFGVIIATGIGVILSSFLAWSELKYHNKPMAATIAAIGLLVLFIGLIEERQSRPKALFNIEVSPDKIVMHGRNKEIALPFDTIEKISFAFLPYFGGSFRLTAKSGKNFRFSVMLERSEYILENLARANPTLLASNPEVDQYRRTAIIADHSWARLYDAMKHWKRISLKYVALPVAFTLGLFLAKTLTHKVEFSTLAVAGWVEVFGLVLMANWALGSSIWIISEMILLFKTRRELLANPTSVRRDTSLEKRINHLAAIFHIAVIFALFLFSILKSLA